jgi:GntR family transcriptional regulator, arabinose operon transcriptional repressor
MVLNRKIKLKDPAALLPPGGAVASQLRERIREGKYKLGSRLADERLLSEQFGVSRRTIREALNLLERDRLIIRQQGRGTFVADPAFTAPVPGQAALIAMMVYEREYFFEKVIQGGSFQAAKQGYTLATGSNGTREEETEHVHAFSRNGILGVILAPRGRDSKENYEYLIGQGMPVVLLDTLLPEVEEDFVAVDNARGIFNAVRHLVDLGHRRIGYVGHNGVIDAPCRSERVRGYLEACREFELPTRPEWFMELDMIEDISLLIRALRAENLPSAFVTYNDTWAIRIIKAAREAGLRVPEDLSVVGFDDSALASGFEIPLTSVSSEQRETGIAAVNLLVDKIQNPRPRPKINYRVVPRLIIRNSTIRNNSNE